MKKFKAYKYIGRNGILVTEILLNGIDHIPMVFLQADEGKILTDGNSQLFSITVEAEDAGKWKEIDFKGQE